MSDQDLPSLFKEAAKLAESVPESMRAAAFNRALDLLMEQSSPAKVKPARKRRIGARARRPGSKEQDSPRAKKATTKQTATASKQRSRSSAGRAGPKAMLDSLIDAGFFATPKTIAEIVNHEKKRRGHTYLPNELSPALVRLLREGRLERDTNDDKVYEYSSR